MTDYPAAHSMDTTWFAVDDDGHVAIFSSGEAGAVPEDAAGDPEDDTLLETLAALPVRGEEIVEPYRDLKDPATSHLGDDRTNHLTLLVDDPSVLGTQASAGRVLRAARGVAVHYDTVPPGLLARLHAAGACHGCFFDYRQDADADPGDLQALASRGLFLYGHTCENWISGPYGREAAPSAPVKADQLPAEIREQLKHLPGVRFAAQPFVQPAALGPCISWETAWLELDGKHVHPFPGQEKEAEKAYGDQKELVFVRKT